MDEQQVALGVHRQLEQQVPVHAGMGVHTLLRQSSVDAPAMALTSSLGAQRPFAIAQATKVPMQFSGGALRPPVQFPAEAFSRMTPGAQQFPSQLMAPQGPVLMPVAEHVVRSSSSPLAPPLDKLASVMDPRQAFVSHMAPSIRGHDGVHRQRSWAGPSAATSPRRSLPRSPLQAVPLTCPPQVASPVAQLSPSIPLASSGQVERQRSFPIAAPYPTEGEGVSKSPREVWPSPQGSPVISSSPREVRPSPQGSPVISLIAREVRPLSQMFEGERRSRSCEVPSPLVAIVQTAMGPVAGAHPKHAGGHANKSCEQPHPVSVRRSRSCDPPWVGASGSSLVSPDIATDRIAALQLEQRRLIGESLAVLVSGALGSGQVECPGQVEVDEIIGEDVSHIEEFQLLFAMQDMQGCSPPQADPNRLTAANLACADDSNSRWCPSGGFIRPHGVSLKALPKVIEGSDSPYSPTRSLMTTDSRQQTPLFETRSLMTSDGRQQAPLFETAAFSRSLGAEYAAATERHLESLKGGPPRSDLDVALEGINRCLRMATGRARRRSLKLVGQHQKAEARNRLLQHKCEGTKGSRRASSPRSPATSPSPHGKERQVIAAAAMQLLDFKDNESELVNPQERNEAIGSSDVDNVAVIFQSSVRI